jgi:ribosomal protein S18 acetylase RimI-like enzyme
MRDVRLVAFQPMMLAEASDMLARAFMTNPLHVAVFGRDALDKNREFFRVGLSVMKGPKLVAMEQARIVGLIHWVASPRCQLSAIEKLRMMPTMISGFGFGSAMGVGAWLSAWTRHDPAEPHVHLGPIGVAPDVRGQRLGQKLMERYCEELARSRKIGYLETDRQENVQFYRRFGFDVVEQTTIRGVTNYFMKTARRQ